MTTELTLLAWTLVLALVQILLPGAGRTRQLGFKWNAGPRDDASPPPDRATGRLMRAQANLFETLPLFAAAVLIAELAGRTGPMTVLGAHFYFWARVAYVPIYALGLPLIRSVVWGFSLAGLLLIIIAVLAPA